MNVGTALRYDKQGVAIAQVPLPSLWQILLKHIQQASYMVHSALALLIYLCHGADTVLRYHGNGKTSGDVPLKTRGCTLLTGLL